MAEPRKYNRFQIPSILEPTRYVCVQIMVPDEPTHFANFWGALHELNQWASYERDAGKSGTKLAHYWQKVLTNIKIDNCDVCPPNLTGEMVSDEMSLHVDCDCNVTVDCPDGSMVQLATTKMLQSPTQPGPQPQPKPGDCFSTDVVLQANQKFLFTVGVGGGDTVEMSNLTGAANDGGSPSWYCPDGTGFGLGTCGAFGHATSGTDPCPSLWHMQLIAQDSEGNCYDATTNFTIDSGVPDGSLLTFQVNDSDLSNNSGSTAFHVKICKNASPATFYYILTDNTFAEPGHPLCADMTYFPLPVGTPTTFTSKIPGDSVNPSNPQSVAFITFSSAQAPTTCLWTNSGNTGYKITALSVIGATPNPGGGPFYWDEFNSGCAGAITSHSGTSLPTLPANILFFEVRSATQFTVQITIEPC